MSDNSFDRLIGALSGLPDVIEVKPTTIRCTTPLLGLSQIFIVQTMRQKDVGDHIFLETISEQGSIRIALTPQVADAIARQRDALTTKSRRKAAKRVAADRMARGEKPAFLKKKGGRK